MPAVRRRAGMVWYPRPPVLMSKPMVVKGLAGKVHRHGCVLCSATYEDPCFSPLTDGFCAACNGRTPPSWETDLRPAWCCAGSIAATARDLTTYSLAGDNTWWLCTVCKRPHIFKPTTVGAAMEAAL
jgi:hypothetical protein